MFAVLEEGRVLGRLDEVAGAIDQIKTRLPALALSSDQDVSIGGRSLHFDRVAILPLHRTHGVAHNLRHAVHGRTVEDGFDIGIKRRILDRAAQHRLDALRDGQVAGPHECYGALAGVNTGTGFPKTSEFVQSRISAYTWTSSV